MNGESPQIESPHGGRLKLKLKPMPQAWLGDVPE